MEQAMSPIQVACKACGGGTALAAEIKKSPQFVSQMVQGDRPIPTDICPAIERGSSGATSCEDLRPDITWHRIPDKDWPWHPNGRPLVDVTRTAEAA